MLVYVPAGHLPDIAKGLRPPPSLKIKAYSLLSGLATDATVATSIRSVTKNAPLRGGLRCFCIRTIKVSGLTASLPGWTFGRSKPESYATCDLIARRTLTGIDAI